MMDEQRLKEIEARCEASKETGWNATIQSAVSYCDDVSALLTAYREVLEENERLKVPGPAELRALHAENAKWKSSCLHWESQWSEVCTSLREAEHRVDDVVSMSKQEKTKLRKDVSRFRKRAETAEAERDRLLGQIQKMRAEVRQKDGVPEAQPSRGLMR
ncbi:MAG: hypothetical protein ACR2PW_04730 [Gammaproteobacteria bacterium]